MPGLIRGVARTAVIAGTATAVSGRVSRRQQGRWAQQEQQQYDQYAAQQQAAAAQAPPPAPAAPEVDMYEELTKLGKLRDAGILSDTEFEVEKAKILRG